MQRLSHFHQNVVRDVDEIVDGTQSDVTQAVAHPVGRRLDFNVVDYRSGVSAAIFVLNFCGKALDIRLYRMIFDRRVFDFLSENGCNFARNSDNRLAIGSICRYRNVKNVFVEAQNLFNINAERGVFGQNKYSVDFGALYNAVVYTEFASGTEHSVAGYAS